MRARTHRGAFSVMLSQREADAIIELITQEHEQKAINEEQEAGHRLIARIRSRIQNERDIQTRVEEAV